MKDEPRKSSCSAHNRSKRIINGNNSLNFSQKDETDGAKRLFTKITFSCFLRNEISDSAAVGGDERERKKMFY
jgi:hypothetical protein